jgi:hypothetical protein
VNDIFKFKKAHLHPPVTVGAALFGLFGNDGIQYAQDRTHRIEVRQLKRPPQLAASFISNQAMVMGVSCARPAIVCGLGQLVL